MSEKITRAIISIPTYNGHVHMGLIGAIHCASFRMKDHGIRIIRQSLLTKCFNMLWQAALKDRERGITHFAMLHADIVPEDGWLDKMLEICETNQTDVLSTIIPLKNFSGLTSTAFEVGEKWKCRRLTMTEVIEGPETFHSEDLLLNTGLMVCDIRKPWANEIVFRFEDSIVNGEAVNVPEDWGFSRQVRELGGKLFATRAIKAQHFGEVDFDNYQAWGTMKTDTAYLQPAIKT